MKILRFFLILLAGLGFNNIHASKSGNQVITPEYIQKIHLQDPARALHLLDSAEQHHLPGIRPFETDILRTMCYEVTGECILEENTLAALWLPTRYNWFLPGKSACWWH